MFLANRMVQRVNDIATTVDDHGTWGGADGIAAYNALSILSLIRTFPTGVVSFASRKYRFARMLLIELRNQGKLGPHIM